MSVLKVREYEHISAVANGIVPVGVEPALASYVVSIAGVSAQTPVFQERTRFVRLHCDLACGFVVAVNPTAIAEQDMSAGQTEYFGVSTTGLRLAVIAAP